MKIQFRKLAAGFLAFSLTLSTLGMTAGAAVTSDVMSGSAQMSGEATEAPVSGDTLIRTRSESAAQFDVSSLTWSKVGSNWRLKDSNGSYKKGFVKYNGEYYYFDANGNMKVGWFTIAGKRYFTSRTTGAKGKGILLTGLWKIDGHYYYLNPVSKPYKGAVTTGFQKIKGHLYYFNSSGRMVTGWFTVSGNKYYAVTSGSAIGQLFTAPHTYGNAVYRFDSSGKYLGKTAAPLPASSKYLHMLDLSQWQGSMDFNKIKASGVKAVIIRCGYGKFDGKLHTDNYFYENIKKAKAAGLAVGVYFFSYAYNNQMAVDEAKYVLRLIKGYKMNLPVYFDWEYDSMTKAKKNMSRSAYKKTNWRTNITNMTAAFCNTITQNGYRAGYYFNLDYRNNYYDPSKLTRYSTWYAYWGTNKPGSNIWAHANTIKTPTSYDLWQFTSRGRIPGISGYVDCNLLLKPSIKR